MIQLLTQKLSTTEVIFTIIEARLYAKTSEFCLAVTDYISGNVGIYLSNKIKLIPHKGTPEPGNIIHETDERA